MTHRTTVALFGLSAAWMTGACNGNQDAKVATGTNLGRLSAAKSVCVKTSLGLAVLDRGSLRCTGNADISGDILLTDRSLAQLGGNAHVRGKIHAEDESDLRRSGNAQIDGGVEIKSMQQEARLLGDFARDLASLKPTQTFQRLDGSQVIEGRDGINVIEVEGAINLAGNSTVTLKGSKKAVFLINVRGDIKVSGKASILVAGGVREQNVLIHAREQGSDMLLAGQGTVSGTFFAPSRGAQLTGNGVIHGSIIASREINLSGNGLTLVPEAFCIDDQDREDDEGNNNGGVIGP